MHPSRSTPFWKGPTKVRRAHPGDGGQGRLHTRLVQHGGHSVIEDVAPAPVEGALLPLRRPVCDVDVPEGLRNVSPDLPAERTSTVRHALAHMRRYRQSGMQAFCPWKPCCAHLKVLLKHHEWIVQSPVLVPCGQSVHDASSDPAAPGFLRAAVPTHGSEMRRGVRAPLALHDEAERGELAGAVADDLALLLLIPARAPVKFVLQRMG